MPSDDPDTYIGQGPEGPIYRGDYNPRSPTTQVVDQLSTEALNTLASHSVVERQRPGGARARPTTRPTEGSLYDRYVDESMRANPYGGRIAEDPFRERVSGLPGSGSAPLIEREGYYDESEFEDPVRGGTQRFPGDSTVILGGMDSAVLTRLQERLDATGFLTGEWVPGAVTPNTERAFQYLLSESNRRGQGWNMTLGQIERDAEEMGILGGGGPGGDAPEPFVAPAYQPPDYATIAQRAKHEVQKVLGRKPDDSELANLTAELTGWHKQAYDAKVAAQRADHEAGISGEGGGTTTPAVDPVSRFQEFIEEKYEAEIDLQEDKAVADRSRDVVESGAGTLSEMSRRGY